jgi:NTE family protein
LVDDAISLADPVDPNRPPEDPKEPVEGIALCLSGGGYRAMLYHVGAILRLNEFGLMGMLNRVSSVSGGSITAGVLAMNWSKLQWNQNQIQNLEEQLVVPIRKIANETIDLPSIVWGIFNPFKTVSDEVAEAYDKYLFDGTKLNELPASHEDNENTSPRTPRFVFNATNVKTGTLWRFSQKYMADWRVGRVNAPDVPLARVVAAASAFPPFLSPMRLDLKGFQFVPGSSPPDVDPELLSEAVLTDGGVYDNLGLETAWKRYKTIYVSDGGRPTTADLQPASDWPRHARRLIDLLERQVGALRVRQTIAAFNDARDVHKGTYWGIATDLGKYSAPSPNFNCAKDDAASVAVIDTRLASLSDRDQRRIINWGYASCDLSMRTYVDALRDQPQGRFPFPSGLS